MSREQLTKLLRQVGVSGTEVGQLSDQLFQQLSSGLSPDLVSRRAAAMAEARSSATAAAAMPPPQRRPAAQQQQQQQQQVSLADAAAAAATARAGQRADAVAALESRPRAAAGGSGRAALMPISQLAIARQAASLPKVDPAAKQAPAQQPESGLEAALRKGEGRVCGKAGGPA